MSDPIQPPPPTPPAPPSAPPPAPGGGGSNAAQQKGLMIVLSYLYILAIVPLLVEKEDREVQWHAKHGLVLLGIDIIVGVGFFIIGLASGGLGCLLLPVQGLLHFALFIVRIVCIVQGVKGQRFMIPGVSNLADSF